MRLIKYTHSCVRLEDRGRVLVIDPGIWSERRALRGVDAVLVTHEHTDHVDALALAELGVPVHAPEGADLGGLDATRVAPGDAFTAAGFRVEAVGGRHASTYGGRPDCPNLGYVVDGALYHPGDGLHVPAQAVTTLLVPIHASWLKTSEAIDFVTAVAPQRTYPIHEAQLNERGMRSIDGWMADATSGCGYRRLAPGETAGPGPDQRP